MNPVLNNINDMFNLYKTIALTSSDNITVQMLKNVTLSSNEIIKGKNETYTNEYFTHLANYLNQVKEQNIDNISFDNFLLYVSQLVNMDQDNKRIEDLNNNLINIKLMGNEDIKKINQRIENIKNSNLSFDEKTELINDLKAKRKDLEEKELQIPDNNMKKEEEEKQAREQEQEQRIEKVKQDNKNKFDSAKTKSEGKKIDKLESEIKRMDVRKGYLTKRTQTYKNSFPKKFGHWFKYLAVLPIITDLYKLGIITYDKYVAIPGKQNKKEKLEKRLDKITAQIKDRVGIVDEQVLINQIKNEVNNAASNTKGSTKENVSTKDKIEELKGYKKEVISRGMTPEQIKAAQNNIGEYKPRGR